LIIDNEDLKIIKEFSKLGENSNVTTWDIMKNIYKNGRDTEHMRVKAKISKMQKHGLFIKDKNGYTLIKDRTIIKKIYFDEKPRNSVCFLVDGKWSAYEI